LRTHIGEKGGVADNQVALAQIALQEGFPARAEAPARQAIEQFRLEDRSDDEAAATAVLARSLLAQGKHSEAREANARAEQLSAASNNGSLRLSIAITTASIQAFSGDAAKASKNLNAIAAEARKFGLAALELEARLALGQIEVAAGNLEAGRSRLAAVQRNARARGYTNIANRAAEAMKR
jgi:ATP/maltotriose-dependent transcriptional regulator MalT